MVAAPLSDGGAVVAVADGMGGHAAGDVASARSLEILVAALRAGASLDEAVRAANEAIYSAARQDPACHGMGTTLVALLQTGGRYWIANVGDSRAYLVRPSGAEQITLDHSFAVEAGRAGELSREEIARSPWRNTLTRAVGTDPDVEVDIFGPYPATIEPHAVLLCTDGLYKALCDAEIHRSLLAAADPEDAAHRLAGLAYQAGSTDNITVAVVAFGEFFGASVQSGPEESRTGVSRDPDGAAVSFGGGASPLAGAGGRPTCTPLPVARVAVKEPATRRRQVHIGRWMRRVLRVAAAALNENTLFFLLAAAFVVWLIHYVRTMP